MTGPPVNAPPPNTERAEPTPSLDAYAAALVPLAVRLVGAVRYEGHPATRAVFDQLRQILRPAGVHPAEALAVILAAMVDERRSPNELLAWVDTARVVDHAVGDLTPREAYALQRRLERADQRCPEHVRQQAAAHRTAVRGDRLARRQAGAAPGQVA